MVVRHPLSTRQPLPHPLIPRASAACLPDCGKQILVHAQLEVAIVGYAAWSTMSALQTSIGGMPAAEFERHMRPDRFQRSAP